MGDYKSSRDAGAKSPASPTRIGASTDNQVRGQFNTGATGIITGGRGSVDADPAKFQLAAGEGWVRVNTTNPDDPEQIRLVWDAVTGIDPLNKAGPGAAISYVWASLPTVYSGEVVTAEITQTQPSDYPDPGDPTPSEFREKVYLGFVVFESFLGIVLAFVVNVRAALNVAAQLADLSASLGSLRVQDGEVRAIGALQLEQDAGVFYAEGANWVTSELVPSVVDAAAISPLLGGTGYRSGANDGRFSVTPGPPTTSLDPTLYDDGSGTPRTVPAGQVTIQRIYYNVTSPGHLFMYGQELYESLAEAHANILTGPLEDIPQLRAEDWVLVAQVAVVQSATDLTDPEQALVYNALPSGKLSLEADPPAMPAPSGIVGTATNFPSGGGAIEFANFGAVTGPGAGAFTLPVDAYIVAVVYTFSHTNPINIGAGESITLTAGLFVPGAALTTANYTPEATTEQIWDSSFSGTHPISVVQPTDPILVNAGTPIGIRTVESGSVTPANADLLATLWYRPA